MPAEPVTECRLALVEKTWPFADERAVDIAAHWDRAVRELPTMWDGRVLLTTDWSISGGTLSGTCTEVAYSAYHAWRTWNYPDSSVFNCFGPAVIRSRDGALLFGRMSDFTSNGGQVYPVAGMLDLADVGPDGTIDLFASTVREMREETGLPETLFRPGPQIVVGHGQLLSVAQVMDFDEDAETLARRIREFIRSEKDPELEDVVVLRRPSDLPAERSFPFCAEILRHILR